MTKNTKSDKALDELIARQDYLVVQANDLSKAFGKLTLSEHKLLDYATSFVTKDSESTDIYECDILDIIHHFGWNTSGKNYSRVANTFKSLHKKDSLYLYVNDKYGEGITMAHLFDYISVHKSGKVSFRFSLTVTPYLIDLRKNYYSFKLSELAQIKSKYTLVMLKLLEANRMGNSRFITVKGTLEEWETWFLGQDKRKTAGFFKRDVLNVAVAEIENKLNMEVSVNKNVNGRRVIGYEVTFKDNGRKSTVVIDG